MLYAHGWFVPQGYSTATAPSLRYHSRPVLAFGYCRCIRLSVCPCVRVCINPKLVRAITQVPLKPSSPNLSQRWKTPWIRFLLWGDQIEIKISLVPGFGTNWFGRLQGLDCFMVSTLCTYSSRQPMVFLRLTSLLFYIDNTKLEPCASISECTPERSQRRFFHKTTNSASTKTHTLSQVAQHLKYPMRYQRNTGQRDKLRLNRTRIKMTGKRLRNYSPEQSNSVPHIVSSKIYRHKVLYMGFRLQFKDLFWIIIPPNVRLKITMSASSKTVF